MLSHGTANEPDRSGYLSLEQAAAHLDVSEKTLRRRIADGTVPAYRLGHRAIRIKITDLDQLLRPIPTAGN